MRNGICPKCGYNDIRIGREVGTMLGLPANFKGKKLHVRLEPRYDVYICTYCGYVELGLSDPWTLRVLADEWPSVSPPPTPQQPG